MAFSLLGTAAGETVIDGAECVTKTWPEYWDVLQNLGVKADAEWVTAWARSLSLPVSVKAIGRCIGIVIDGCPAGLAITEKIFKLNWITESRANAISSTKRAEADKVDILSGIFGDIRPARRFAWRSGTKTQNQKATKKTKDLMRPGHADYTAFMKYGGFTITAAAGGFPAGIRPGL